MSLLDDIIACRTKFIQNTGKPPTTIRMSVEVKKALWDEILASGMPMFPREDKEKAWDITTGSEEILGMQIITGDPVVAQFEVLPKRPRDKSKPFKMGTFDIEIKNDPTKCSKGWGSHSEFGISVLALCHHEKYPDYRIELYTEETMSDCLHAMAELDMLSGFNSKQFDMKVLHATVGRLGLSDLYDSLGISDLPHFDVYEAIRNTGVFMRAKGLYSLNGVMKNTLGREKTDHGANAPLMFQDGRIKELHEYVTVDVTGEADLVRFVEQNGYILDGNNEKLYISKPSDLMLQYDVFS